MDTFYVSLKPGMVDPCPLQTRSIQGCPCINSCALVSQPTVSANLLIAREDLNDPCLSMTELTSFAIACEKLAQKYGFVLLAHTSSLIRSPQIPPTGSDGTKSNTTTSSADTTSTRTWYDKLVIPEWWRSWMTSRK